MPVHQLMVKNGVTIFFQGHDHLFARQERDGMVYQERRIRPTRYKFSIATRIAQATFCRTRAICE